MTDQRAMASNASGIKRYQYVSFIIIAIITSVVYYPSLFHTARADQIAYLADMAKADDLWSLTVGSYAFNRTREFVAGDHALFRPLLYLLMGTEKWSFGYEFFWWQITNLLMHLCIAWLLLKIMLNERKHLFAPLMVLYFSVQFASMEMVIWHHVAGYLLFCIFLLSAIYNLRRYEAEGSPIRLYLVFGALLLASFTYELGNAASLLIAGYMAINNIFGRKKYGWAIVIAILAVPVMYTAVSMTDLYLRFGNFDDFWGISTFDRDAGASSTSFVNVMLASREWALRGLLPETLVAHARARMQIREMSSLMSPSSLQNIITAAVTIGLYLFFVWEARKKEFIKNNLGFIVLILLLMLSYASIVVFGRVNERGFAFVMYNNTYYAYISNLLLLIMLYAALNVPGTARTRTVKLFSLLEFTFAICLLMIIWSNAQNTYRMNIMMCDYSRPVNVMVQEIDDLIAEHSHEDDFSFSVSKGCPGNYNVSWLTRRRDATGKLYSLAEVLYPKYYVSSDGKYDVRCSVTERKVRILRRNSS